MMRTIDKTDFRNKAVIVRVDWNVTLGKALQIVDDTRIERTMPTIELLLDRGAKKIVLLSHLGKPGGKADPKLSLTHIVRYVKKNLNMNISLCESLEDVKTCGERLVMLENLRFWPGEESNDPKFAQELAGLGEIYVNEAFGESHREVASIVGIPNWLPNYAGLWLRDEIETILKIRNWPAQPLVLVMGGAKIADKIKLLEYFRRKATTILLGGGIANTFLAAQGFEMGISLYDPENVAWAKHLMEERKGARIILPIDATLGEENSEFNGAVDNLDKINSIEDIGLATRKIFEAEIAIAATVIWNGPMGRVEQKEYRAGTQAIFEAISKNEKAYTLVGGGDTLASIGEDKHLRRIDHVSTGGGAMLKLLEAGTLPGIDALNA